MTASPNQSPKWPGWPAGQRPPALAKDWPPEAIEAEGPGPWLDWLAAQAFKDVSSSDGDGSGKFWYVGGEECSCLRPWDNAPDYIPPSLRVSSGLGPAGRALEALLAKSDGEFIVMSHDLKVSTCGIKIGPHEAVAKAGPKEPAVAVARALALLAHSQQRAAEAKEAGQ